MLSTYRRALATPGALRFSASGALARMPISMTALGIVILVSDRTGSYGVAAGVSAAYVVANAVGGIPLARLVDRRGQRRVLAPTVALSVVALVLVVVAVEADAAAPVPHLLAALSGVTMPNIGAAVRARWSFVAADRRVLDTAFALEAVNDEIVFIVGPTLVALLSAAWHPWAGLATAAVFASVGTALLVAQRRTEPPLTRAESVHRSPMPWRAVAPLAVSALSLGALLGACEIATVAFTEEQGRKALAGVLLAVWALGSLLAGLVVGAMTFRRSPAQRYRAGSLALVALVLPLPFVDSLLMLGFFLLLCGFAISPTLIAAISWTESLVPTDRLNEGIAAVTTGLVAGIAPGAALVGVVVDAHGASASYWVPVGIAALGVLVGWSAQRLSPPPGPRVSAPGPVSA
ncbi:MFS transporter [Nocardioides sp. HDW12B]|uniref:MFS transporter n=1 Tax=Nocardioides sp. HDW12B TaxID=2714939 RepID=UPI001F0E2923|nr:MFS transporter [Nocardioides sp. HDW12B]